MCTVIINYGMGNLDSVYRAVEECGGNPIITSEPKDLEKATHIILPGVGAYPIGMKKLREAGFVEELNKQVIEYKIPFLGICLGMQLLSTRSFEIKETAGLNWIEGDVVKLKINNPKEKIPHIGWNEVIYENNIAPIFDGVASGKDFYFVHSFHFKCNDNSNIIATTPYCGKFISAIQKENIFGVQFHPEKSQKAGFMVLKNFLKI